MIDWSALVIATSDGPIAILRILLPSLIWAEVLGVPVAWFKLRKTSEWSNRPQQMRRLDLLARYVGKITGMVGIWALVIAASALFASVVS